MSDYIPWDSLMLLITLNTIIAFGLSIFLGLLVARAVRGSALTGVLVGLLLFVGPMLWYVREVRKDSALLRIERAHSGGLEVLVASGALLVASALLLVSMFTPWINVEGEALSRSVALGGSAADTAVGVMAIALTIAVLLAAGLAALLLSARGRAAAVIALAGAVWLTVAVDAAVIATMADVLADLAESSTAGQTTASVDLGSALWLTLASVTAMFVSASSLALHKDDDSVDALVSASIRASAPVLGGSSTRAPAPSTSSIDYGDGF